MRYTPLEIDGLVLRAQKPSRYAGGEVNSIQKDLKSCRATWALCFPDTYEVGMSNVGFRVLYHVLNVQEGIACERAFMPWPDMEALLREKKVPLFSLESRVPLRDFDVLGFTMQFELCYTSILAMLELSGIPLYSRDRSEADPLILGGGPCSFNPEPVADFFDAVVVGEGEEVVLEITSAVAAWRKSGASRRDLLWRLSEIPGVYVPSFFEPRYGEDKRLAAMAPLKPGYESVARRVVPDLNAVPQPDRPVLASMQTVHDRLPLEIQRGCTRGCRFCQVGMITRPTRQRDPAQVLKLAEEGLKNTGYEEVGFLSLSAGDYEALNPMLEDFFTRFAPDQIAVSLPSLRTETMNERLAAQISKVRKTGFTMAPEAATERMRRVINKGNKEEDLLHAVKTVFQAGWSLVKLYFMIGLPTETDEDVRAIAHLAKKCLRVGRAVNKGAQINVAVSTFVPKPFTPFQWEPVLTFDQTRRKHDILRGELGRGAIRFKYHEAQGSAMESALTRGDRRCGDAVLAAYRMGQRLDGWTEHFSHEVWMKAFEVVKEKHGVDFHFFAHRERGEDECLPWDRIDCGVTQPYLLGQRKQALAEAELVDCVLDSCSVCGACDYEVVANRVYKESDYRPAPPPAPRPTPSPIRTHVRVRYGKADRAIALSHLEVMTALMRTLRRARIPTAFSEGFHPKPKVSFGPACPVGVESRAEYFDVEVVGPVDLEGFKVALSGEMPRGLAFMDAEIIPPRQPSLSASIRAMHYRAELPAELPADRISAAVQAFLQAEKLEIARESHKAPRPGRGEGRRGPALAPAPKRIDLKLVVTHLASVPSGVELTLRAGPEGSAKPSEVLLALFGENVLPLEGVRLYKEGVSFAREGQKAATGGARFFDGSRGDPPVLGRA